MRYAKEVAMKMNHLHIAVPNVSEAQEFFERFFSMKLQFQHGEGVFLTDSSGFLLAIDPLKKGESLKLPDWFHYGFCVPDKKTVKRIYDQMKETGIKFDREYREFGDDAANFYCWSPGPLKLEVSWNND
jgi:catechol 2,3-dioxygenase-like lactoylglutathione lyase family enzyme